jgi:t-SNARE complex subunit (syntaxin)
MTYEERRVVTDSPNEVTTTPVQREVVETTPETVVEQRPATRTVVSNGDPVGSAWAASQMIQTIVWSIVVLVLLVVVLWVLHVYLGLF